MKPVLNPVLNMETLSPSDAKQLAQALRESAASGRSIALRGAGSKDAMGGPVPDAGVELRLDQLSGILEYEPHDLTIRVAAGTPWRELTATLSAQGQMLPLDPPCAATATVGGVVASNCSGPRRRQFGTARDMVIGMTLATLDGALVQTGGMVVKNVAGLDMQKALIGSFGTLAAIASVNFKLAPLPDASRTFVFAFDTAEECIAARDRVLVSVLQPAAIDILNPAAARLAGRDGFVLAVRAGGSETVLARYARELPGSQALEGAREAAFWYTVQEFAPEWVGTTPARSVVRVGHALSELGEVLKSAPGACIARAGNGVAYLAFDGVGALQAWMLATQSKPWSRVVEWSGADVRSACELWPAAQQDFAVMERLKLLFDPLRQLNRGRLYGRL
jgi:glycolate oxidase FAD binding subunit